MIHWLWLAVPFITGCLFGVILGASLNLGARHDAWVDGYLAGRNEVQASPPL